MENKTIEYLILAILYLILFGYFTHRLRKMKNGIAMDISDAKADLKKDAKSNQESTDRSIEKLRGETPILSIKNNEAFLDTRDGREIHRYELTKTK